MGHTVIANGVRNWASIIDGNTVAQAARTNAVPIMAGPLALMPDAHVGMGATVGSVIATDSAIIPAAVGVDLGCGMLAAETTLDAADLPDDLSGLLSAIERLIPAGVGQGHDHDRYGTKWLAANPLPDGGMGDGRIAKKALQQLGTLGSGNHFGELCIDSTGTVWWVLHSGSRGPGNLLAQAHIRLVKGLESTLQAALEDPDLAWFVQGTPEFDRYIADLRWAQQFALDNRRAMVDRALGALAQVTGRTVPELTAGRRMVNCHHNYAEVERHDGRDVWITRKGAIHAGRDVHGVIPGSMGDRSYIVRGLGNADSYDSAPHGAGRVMSRSKAKKTFTADDLTVRMEGRAWLGDRAGSLIDEHPDAYKPITQVMDDAADLVEVVEELVQVLNYKGC